MARTIVITRGQALEPHKQNIPRVIRDANRYGMWCKVLKRYSTDHSVDVETAEGFTVTRIPVASREWVTVEYPVLGERNLPPVNSLVFMFMPTGGIDNAFIFGSCFLPSYDKHVDEFLTEGKEDNVLTKKEGNWHRSFDKITGDIEITGTDDDDYTLTLIIKKSEKKIKLNDWNGNNIIIDENGIKVTDTNENKVTVDSSGLKAEDKTGNSLTMDAGGIKIEAKSILELIGNMIKAVGTAIPGGRGGWCAIPIYPYTGMDHVGDTLVGG